MSEDNFYKLYLKEFPILTNILVVVLIISGIFIVYFYCKAYKKYKGLSGDLKKSQRIKAIKKNDSIYYLLLLRTYLNFILRALLSDLVGLYSFFILFFIYILYIFMNPFYIHSLYEKMEDVNILKGSIIAIITVFLLKNFLKNLWKYIKSRIRDYDLPIPTESIDTYILQKSSINNRLLELKKNDLNKYRFENYLYENSDKNNYYFSINDKKSVVAVYRYEARSLYIKQNNKIQRYNFVDCPKNIMKFSFECGTNEVKKYQINDLKKELFNNSGKWVIKFSEYILIDKFLDKKQCRNLYRFVSAIQVIYREKLKNGLKDENNAK